MGPTREGLTDALRALGDGAGAAVTGTRWLTPEDGPRPALAADIAYENGRGVGHALRNALRNAFSGPDGTVDWCLDHTGPRERRVVVCDMDSTLIGCECVDELADVMGIKDKVAAITEEAMAGRMDFEEALTARVALLKGLDAARLDQVYAERVRLNRGAKALGSTMSNRGALTAVVSGGFTAFTARVSADAGFQRHYANELQVDHGRVTGRLLPPILGAKAKANTLRMLCDEAEVRETAAMAVGDGANDLAMVKAAGLGVGYRPKPALEGECDGVIWSGDLRSALYFQGLPADVAVEAQPIEAASPT